MDFSTALTTYGPLVGLLLVVAYEIVKGLSARGKSQDAREKTLDAALSKIIDTFQSVSEKSAGAYERVANIFDRVTQRMDDNAKDVASSLKEATSQRSEQTILLQALNKAWNDPLPHFGGVISAINGGTKDVVMDSQTDIMKELKAIEEQIKTSNADITAKIERLMIAISTTAPATPPQQTVTVNIPPVVPAGAMNEQAKPDQTSAANAPGNPVVSN